MITAEFLVKLDRTAAICLLADEHLPEALFDYCHLLFILRDQPHWDTLTGILALVRERDQLDAEKKASSLLFSSDCLSVV